MTYLFETKSKPRPLTTLKEVIFYIKKSAFVQEEASVFRNSEVSVIGEFLKYSK